MKNELNLSRMNNLKLLFLGDHKVGKSSLIYKFVIEQIPRHMNPTIGNLI